MTDLDRGDLVDLTDLSDREWQVYLAGRLDGRVEGLQDGRADNARDWWRAGWLQGHHDGWQAADRAASIGFDLAVRNVRALSVLDPHEVHELKGRIRTLEAALRTHEQRQQLRAVARPGAAA